MPAPATCAEGWEYALIVNRTPYEKGHVTMHFSADEVEEISCVDGLWRKGDGRGVALSFAPGQGRLFRFRRTITLLT